MKLPATLPRPSVLLDSPTAIEEMTHYLGLSQATVRAYRNKDRAPRAAHWAMYWVSSWGREWMGAEVALRNQLLLGQVRSLQGEVASLKQYIAHLESGAAAGNAANEAAFEPRRWARPVSPAPLKDTFCNTPTAFAPTSQWRLRRAAVSIGGSNPGEAVLSTLPPFRALSRTQLKV